MTRLAEYEQAVGEFLSAQNALCVAMIDYHACACRKRGCALCSPWQDAYDRQQMAFQALEALDKSRLDASPKRAGGALLRRGSETDDLESS